jgi:hypothetical protein
VYSRADFSRTATFMVGPFLTATGTSAVAYEFRDAATGSGRFMRKVE